MLKIAAFGCKPFSIQFRSHFHSKPWRLLALLLLGGAAGGRAAVTPLNYWRMGEADAGAAAGVLAATTVDSAGTANLTNSPGGARYSASVSSAGASATGSSLCLNFSNGVSYVGGPVPTTVNNNFGVEGWFFPRTNSSQELFYNGNGGSSGWGLGVSGGNYQILFGGVVFSTTTAAVTTNVWIHLALVENNGTATFYTNGVAASSVVATPNPASGSFAIGANPGGGNYFLGLIDEVRVFSFAAGQFSTSDLLYNAGPPTAVNSGASNPGTTNATLNGSVNPHGLATGWSFQYGQTTGYGSQTSITNLAPSQNSSAISAIISNLVAFSLYHFRVVVTNSAGTNYSADGTFTTGLPAIVSAAPVATTTSNASLQLVVNPQGFDTTVQVFYDLVTNYGSVTVATDIGAGSANVTLTNVLSNLFTGCTYHYIVVAQSSHGAVSNSDATFTTPGTATATVTSTADNGGAATLRTAILNAAGNGTINITATGTLTLTNPLPAIFKGLTINGPGAGSLTISGNNAWRIFFVDAAAGAAVNINNVALANGKASGGAGGAGYCGGGGGMGAGGGLFVNAGAVTLSNVIFSGSAARGGDGGAWNTATGYGGGGGLGGNGGSSLTNIIAAGGAGGGGFFGNGGIPEEATNSSGNSGAGGGGGFFGAGGNGGYYGGGGGAFGAGQNDFNLNNPAAGGVGGGGASGINGQTFGGGGGGGSSYQNGVGVVGNGGAGGRYGGGGGAENGYGGGPGGDFGGGGATPDANAGAGGFGGGGGGALTRNNAGPGGFGGGGGGEGSGPQRSGGAFGGAGGYYDYYTDNAGGGGGGGGAALGGAVFVRGTNNAIVTVVNSSLDAGTLTAGAGVAGEPASGPLGAGVSSVTGQTAGTTLFSLGGTNVFNVTTGTNAVAGTIADGSGAGVASCAVAKNGNGSLVLAASNSYAGATLVNAGTLYVSGNISSSSNLSIASGATLAGSGTTGNVTLNSGGTMAANVGTLTTGAESWAGTANYNWQIYDAAGAAGVGYGTLAINGSLDISSVSTLNLNLWSLSSLTPQTTGHLINFPTLAGGQSWTLIQTTGGITGFNASHCVVNTAATDGAGGFTGTVAQFTLALSVSGNNLVAIPVTQPFLSAGAPTSIAATSATLNAQVNPYNAASSVYFLYGTTTSYGSTNTVSAGGGNAAGPASSALSGLVSGATYHYQIVASNAYGSVTSGDQTFLTLSTAPAVTTVAASSITGTGATLHATVNPDGAATGYYFKYGLTTSYGSFTATNTLAAGTSPVAVNIAISGLSPGNITYHFLAVATNGIGTNAGSDLTFATPALAPTVGVSPVTGIYITNATLNALVTPNGAATTTYFKWGPTNTYGHTNAVNAGAGNAAVPVMDSLTNLAQFTVYHYQVLVSNTIGTAATGDQVFVTSFNNSTTLNYWRMGENDPGAVAGGPMTNLVDATGNQNLPLAGGAATYSSAVSQAASNYTVSTLCVNFSNGVAYATGAVPTTVYQDFGVEGWFNPATVAGGILFYNGNAGTSGWGLGYTGGYYQILFGGVVFYQTSATAVPNTWTHVALVCQSNTATLYTNGVMADAVAGTPNPPNGGFAIAAVPGGGGVFQGLIDELRIFTFPDGGFSTNDFLILGTGRPVLQNVSATGVTLTSATLNATVIPNNPGGGGTGLLTIRYGTTSNYSFTTNYVISGVSTPFTTNEALAGLTTSVTYHYQVTVSNVVGTVSSGDQTFLTVLPAAPVSVGVSNITSTTATLYATVNPDGTPVTYYFAYGPTAGYGSFTPTNALAAGLTAQLVSAPISGLLPATMYHFAVVASNGLATIPGGDIAFTTPAGAPVVSIPSVTGINITNATLTAMVTPNGAATTAYFKWGPTITYGHTDAVAAGTGDAAVPVTDGLTNLAQFTVYHYQVLVSNTIGTAATGDQVFITSFNNSTTLNDWRMGENDPGAVAGGPMTNLVDATGNQNLPVAGGAATYSSAVSQAAANGAGSTLCVNFSNGMAYASGAVPTTVNQDFGVEGWFNPATVAGGILFYNGNGGTSGWGLGYTGGYYQILFGGVVFYQTLAAAVPNTWTHVALVCQSNTATLYTNGVMADAVPATPNPPNGGFAIAAVPGGGGVFQGLIDELRIFTFPDGGFSTNDFLILGTGRPVLQNVSATGVTLTSATLNATVIPNNPGGGGTGLLTIRYGTTSNYSSTTNYVISGVSTPFTTNESLAGLTTGATYHYQITVSNLIGTVSSGDQTFLTIVPAAPVSVGASNITSTAATLYATVNPDGTPVSYYFEYGPTAGYGSFTPTNALAGGSTAQSVSAPISGLLPATMYHFAVAASNGLVTNFGGDVAFTTLASAPVVSIQSVTGIYGGIATLNAQVTPNGADTTVFFLSGSTTSYGTTNSLDAGTSDSAGPVSDALSNLPPLMTYHYQLVASNAAGVTSSGDQTFVTAQQLPAVVALGASNITSSSAVLFGTVNPEGVPAGAFFAYGQTVSYDSSTAQTLFTSGSAAVLFSNTIGGLLPGTLYHFAVISTNTGGTNVAPDATFTTLALAPTLQNASVVLAPGSNATFYAVVNPNGGATTVYFLYGTNTSYGTTNVGAGGSGTSFLNVSDPVSSLAAFTIYHYQMIVSNAMGVVSSPDQTFTTPNGPLVPLNYWRMGEDDPGAEVGGGAFSATVDRVAGDNLNPVGVAVASYISSVSAAAASETGSSLGLSFPGGGFMSGAASSGLTDNFGLELWVNLVAVNASGTIVYNGNPGNSGWGIIRTGNGQIAALFGGVLLFGTIAVPTGVWLHLALVRDSGRTTLYTNGVAAATITSSPNPPSGALTLAQSAFGLTPTIGAVDELRIFTFAPGTFSTNQLLLHTSVFPVIANVAASAITTNGATLAASLTPNFPFGGNGQFWFDYGPTTNYGNSTPMVQLPAGTAVVGLSNAVSGLLPGTLYHFRPHAITSAAPTEYGADTAFTTLTPPAVFDGALGWSNGQFSLQFSGTGPAGNILILTSTNASLPISNWTVLGSPLPVTGGYQFTDTNANNGNQFYILKKP